MSIFFSTNLQCSGKLDLNIFRPTVPIICIPLTHSEQRHLSRNTADKRETINPGKITGTESLSCILPEMRQRSYYVHPSGLASESKQYSSADMVLFKGTLHWSETSVFWQSSLLLRCFSVVAFSEEFSAPQKLLSGSCKGLDSTGLLLKRTACVSWRMETVLQ